LELNRYLPNPRLEIQSQEPELAGGDFHRMKVMSAIAEQPASGPAYLCTPNPESKTLLICFGGVAGRLGMRAFEFGKITGDLPVSRIFLKDPSRRFYLAGIPGLGSNVKKAAAGLRALAHDMGAERIICLGNSMGGFGAIVYGALLDARVIHAFKSRTTVHWHDLLRLKDHRNYQTLLWLNLRFPVCWPYRDLRKLLSSREPQRGKFNLFFPAGSQLYTAYAKRLGDLPCVKLHEETCPGAGQNLIKSMRDSGRLRLLLEEAISQAQE
jgi:hypothetical protein